VGKEVWIGSPDGVR